MLLGLLIPSEGEISILGTDMLTKRHLALPRMNFSSPYVGIPARLTLREILIVYANLYGLNNVKHWVAYAAKGPKIIHTLKIPISSLSTGQKIQFTLAKELTTNCSNIMNIFLSNGYTVCKMSAQDHHPSRITYHALENITFQALSQADVGGQIYELGF